MLTTLEDLVVEQSLSRIGELASSSAERGFYATLNSQIDAWRIQLEFLAKQMDVLRDLRPEAAAWTLLLEYEIPRRQRRIDAVLLSERIVFVIECKVGAAGFERADLWQVEDYALDLRDFQARSRDNPVVPMLVCTRAMSKPETVRGVSVDVHCIGSVGLAERIDEIAKSHSTKPYPLIDAIQWDRAHYSPTPSIIEATQKLFSGHSVKDLSHTYADNLDLTVEAVRRAALRARAEASRTICFITGVPGAGKTLAGISAINATTSDDEQSPRGAYLSGNGPLVAVLREALARDASKDGESKKSAKRRAATLVQNVHEFIHYYGAARNDLAPDEHIVAFDEAQRAWHQTKLTKRHPTVHASEPELMLDIMSRAPGWATIIAIVGGGQEIHSGEAGLEEWGRALALADDRWHVYASPDVLRGADSTAFHRLFADSPPAKVVVYEDPAMHLSVSVRSPRARHLAEWVNAVLDLDAAKAKDAIQRIDGFRMGLTRDLATARRWLRDASRDEMRCGLLASSGNLRLRAEGLEMMPEFLTAYPLEHWFLNGRDDIRSSSSLEVAMSEFKVQGLEIDLVGLCWGDDLTVTNHEEWEMRRFVGTAWRHVRSDVDQRYLLNKYRVLLTRAREGIVIYVPRGDVEDPTRDPVRLDRTADFLMAAGLAPICET